MDSRRDAHGSRAASGGGDGGAAATLGPMFHDPAVLIAAPLIVTAAYTIFGISGFGSALVSIPLLAHFLPLKTVVPMVVLLDFSAAASTGWQARREVERAEVKRLLPAIAVGVTVGVLLLAGLPGRWLLVALGLFVIGYGARGLARGPGRHRPVSRHFAWPTGVIAGILGALFGAGGPLYVAYLSGRIEDPTRFRATLAVVFSLGTGLRIALFLLTGLLLDWQLWAAAVLLLPLMFAGTAIGRHIHLRLSRQQIVRFFSLLLIASGSSLLVRGLAGF